MWRINAILFGIIFGAATSNAHPVSVLTGDAVWAENQLILTMRIPADQLLLHCQVQADSDGYIFRGQLAECEMLFHETIRNNFLLDIPENILPEVKQLSGESTPEKVLLSDLHDYNYSFEIRFNCISSPDKITLRQTMGNYNRGLQSTALITFHLEGNQELVPLYNDLPVTIDLINNTIVDGKIRPVLMIDHGAVAIYLPTEWTVHGLPFELSFDDVPSTGNLVEEENEMINLQCYRFQIPAEASKLTIMWTNMTWQMRKIELIMKKPGDEKILVFSRFKKVNTIALQ